MAGEPSIERRVVIEQKKRLRAEAHIIGSHFSKSVGVLPKSAGVALNHREVSALAALEILDVAHRQEHSRRVGQCFLQSWWDQFERVLSTTTSNKLPSEESLTAGASRFVSVPIIYNRSLCVLVVCLHAFKHSLAKKARVPPSAFAGAHLHAMGITILCKVVDYKDPRKVICASCSMSSKRVAEILASCEILGSGQDDRLFESNAVFAQFMAPLCPSYAVFYVSGRAP